MTYRSVGLALSVVVLLALSACANKSGAHGEGVYQGTLIRSVAAGGETTGWALGDSGGNVLMQVDVSAVQESAEKLENKRVRVYGEVEFRQHPETGGSAVLVANKIEAAR